MNRLSMALALLCVTAFGCRGRAPDEAMSEPPPPLIEPELAPGSRLVDPRADELVRQMSDRLARAAAFALEADEVYDEVPEQSPRRQLTNLRRVAMRRPDRLDRRYGWRRPESVVLVRREGVLSPRQGAECVDERQRTADCRPGP